MRKFPVSLFWVGRLWPCDFVQPLQNFRTVTGCFGTLLLDFNFRYEFYEAHVLGLHIETFRYEFCEKNTSRFLKTFQDFSKGLSETYVLELYIETFSYYQIIGQGKKLGQHWEYVQKKSKKSIG
ncbi:hypothetical protein C1645_742855 [Glomus cerebriforme]|uniref:Uncharacterized protein n=1 Tax=Glomus cerebriforme TaxID=658196 RepID=A0A397SFT6_9GLOM|nr:hypothetical protein C1645_742855 [Glomus cerebriforme]